VDPNNVEKLQNFLARLGEHLAQAQEQYLNGDDGGRSGAIRAIVAAAEFINSIEEFHKRNLSMPLVAASAALADLQVGTVNRMLKPVTFRNRPPDTEARQGLRAYSAASMEVLMRAGYSKQESAEAVARHLVKSKVDVSGDRSALTWRTVAYWRDQVRRSNATSFSASIYREFFASKDLSRLTKSPALKKKLLERLDAIIAATKQSN